jgi:hypothetical protein
MRWRIMRRIPPICPKCQSIKKDIFGNKKVFPRWKTKVKGQQWECRHCGYVEDILHQAFLKKEEAK